MFHYLQEQSKVAIFCHIKQNIQCSPKNTLWKKKKSLERCPVKFNCCDNIVHFTGTY